MKIKTLTGFTELTGIDNLNFCLANSVAQNRFFGPTNTHLWKIQVLEVCPVFGYVLYSCKSFEGKKRNFAIVKINEDGSTKLLPTVYTEKTGKAKFKELTAELFTV
jgi:hypothetical protein